MKKILIQLLIPLLLMAGGLGLVGFGRLIGPDLFVWVGLLVFAPGFIWTVVSCIASGINPFDL